MNTRIHAKLESMPPRFHSKAESRIRRRLRRWRHRLASVQVFLRDESGPRGAAETSCRLVLGTHRNGAIVAKGRGRDAHGALSEALQRAREGIRRREERLVAKKGARSLRRGLPAAA